MTEDTSPENLRKFLLSEDPAMRLMGISMAKGINLLESNQIVYALLLWDSELKVKSSAKEFVEEMGSENIIDREQAKDEGVPDRAGDEGILVSQLSTSVLLSFLKSSNEDMVIHACMAFTGEVGRSRTNDSSDNLVKGLVSFLKVVFDKLTTKQASDGYSDPAQIVHPAIETLWHDDYFEELITVICKGANLEETKKQIEDLTSSLENVWDYNNGAPFFDSDRDYWSRWMDCSIFNMFCPTPYQLAHGIIDLQEKFLPERDSKGKICSDSYNWLVRYITPESTSEEDEDSPLYNGFIELVGEFGSLESYKELLISFLESENYDTIENAASALENLGMSEEELEELGYEY